MRFVIYIYTQKRYQEFSQGVFFPSSPVSKQEILIGHTLPYFKNRLQLLFVVNWEMVNTAAQ